MELIVFEKEAYYKLIGEIKSILKEAISEEKKEKSENDWIPIKEAMILLNIKSKTTLQNYCNEGTKIYSKHGRKILYSKKSVGVFLEDNSTNGKSYRGKKK
jgi:hypothetical protein